MINMAFVSRWNQVRKSFVGRTFTRSQPFYNVQLIIRVCGGNLKAVGNFKFVVKQAKVNWPSPKRPWCNTQAPASAHVTLIGRSFSNTTSNPSGLRTAEISRLRGIPAKEVAPIAARWRTNQQAFSPSPGTYVPIPSQFRSWGTVPASHYIDPLMNHLGHPYYVGYLSAAQAHDAAHQRPQIFQIVTTARLVGRAFGRVRLGFIVSKTTTNKPTIATNTPTGTMNVSTPEVTVPRPRQRSRSRRRTLQRSHNHR